MKIIPNILRTPHSFEHCTFNPKCPRCDRCGELEDALIHVITAEDVNETRMPKTFQDSER